MLFLQEASLEKEDPETGLTLMQLGPQGALGQG